MTEPRPIGLFDFRANEFKSGYWKFEEFVPAGNRTYLFDNGELRSYKDGEEEIQTINFATFGYLHNQPITEGDWYWNEDNQRFIECAALSEEAFLELAMSKTERITITEYAS